MYEYIILETKHIMCVCLSQILVLKMSSNSNEKLQMQLYNIAL